jgi:hypothetical protein
MRKSGKLMMEVEGHRVEGRDVKLYLSDFFFFSFRSHIEETARSEIEVFPKASRERKTSI